MLGILLTSLEASILIPSACAEGLNEAVHGVFVLQRQLQRLYLSESTAPNDGATAQWNCSLMMQFHVSPESR